MHHHCFLSFPKPSCIKIKHVTLFQAEGRGFDSVLDNFLFVPRNWHDDLNVVCVVWTNWAYMKDSLANTMFLKIYLHFSLTKYLLYIYKYYIQNSSNIIFLSLRCGVEAKRGVEFRHSAHIAFRIWRQVGNGVS